MAGTQGAEGQPSSNGWSRTDARGTVEPGAIRGASAPVGGGGIGKNRRQTRVLRDRGSRGSRGLQGSDSTSPADPGAASPGTATSFLVLVTSNLDLGFLGVYFRVK